MTERSHTVKGSHIIRRKDPKWRRVDIDAEEKEEEEERDKSGDKGDDNDGGNNDGDNGDKDGDGDGGIGDRTRAVTAATNVDQTTCAILAVAVATAEMVVLI
jgi:hypothetical protein